MNEKRAKKLRKAVLAFPTNQLEAEPGRFTMSYPRGSRERLYRDMKRLYRQYPGLPFISPTQLYPVQAASAESPVQAATGSTG